MNKINKEEFKDKWISVRKEFINKDPINLTKDELKNLIIERFLEDYRYQLSIDYKYILYNSIVKLKQILEEFNDYLDDWEESIFGSILENLEFCYTLKSEIIDVDVFYDIYEDLDIEELFKQKYGMDFRTFAKKELEIAEESIRLNLKPIPKLYNVEMNKNNSKQTLTYIFVYPNDPNYYEELRNSERVFQTKFREKVYNNLE